MLLIGGASGGSKTTLARQLAGLYGVSIFQIDDLQVALERLTTPAQQPALHFWRTNWEEFSRLSDHQLTEHFVSIARGVFEPALEAVVSQHLEDASPVIIEGDFPRLSWRRATPSAVRPTATQFGRCSSTRTRHRSRPTTVAARVTDKGSALTRVGSTANGCEESANGTP